MDALKLINSLRNTDRAIEVIYMNGSCYRFHLFLKELFPQALPLINSEKDHIITNIDGRYFDITGEVGAGGFASLDGDDIEMVKDWSFCKSRLLSLGDCQNCDEPILTGF